MFLQKHIQGRSLYWRLKYGRVLQQEIKYNKLIYGGTCILDLSKLTMMKFHHNIIHNSFEGRYSLIYSDTDSLVYNIQHDNNYRWVEKQNHILTFPILSEKIWKTMRTKKVIGKFKDETNSFPITDFVALNPKCYSFKHLKKDDTINHTKKSNGVEKICGKASDNAWQLYGYDEHEWAVEPGCRFV